MLFEALRAIEIQHTIRLKGSLSSASFLLSGCWCQWRFRIALEPWPQRKLPESLASPAKIASTARPHGTKPRSLHPSEMLGR